MAAPGDRCPVPADWNSVPELVGCAADRVPARSTSFTVRLSSLLRPRTRSRLRLAAGLTTLALLVGVVPATAQTQKIEDAKAEREEARAEAADAASDLDPLLAEDAELEAAVADLEAHVATQQAKLEGIQQSLAASRVEAEAADQRVLDMQLEIGAIRGALIARAVDAYTTSDDQRVDALFTTDDVTVAAHKRALLNTIASNEADLIDQLRAAEDKLGDLADEADAAVQRVEEEEAAEAAQLGELEAALANERRLKQALGERIAAVQAEIDALEAEEAELTSLITSLIAEEEARERAEAEAKRRAEEARRLAEQAPKVAEPDVPTPQPLPPPETAGNVGWPTGGVVTSGFGPRWGRMHNGLDISAPAGTAVVAAASGTVIQASAYGGYGNMVVIDHGGGFTTIYAHLSDYAVSTGQSVGQGARVGSVGCTGRCTGDHLHFETRDNGVAQDPFLYL